jgi:2-keto-3-deoxy-L-rhamnonate aldolase RhmA
MTAAAEAPTLARRLRSGESVVGTFLNLGSPVAAEICGLAGFDWVLIDLEHGSGSEPALLHELQAVAGTGATAVVRVEANDPARIGRALDFGAEGIMVPRVDTADDAVAAVAAMRYPPQGARGVALMNRSGGFGRRPGGFAGANERVLGIVQIESPQGVANASAIAEVDGVHALFIGPSDLSHSMGIPGDLEAAPFQDAVLAVVAAARDAGKASGILAQSAEQLAAYAEQGFQLLAVGGDGIFLAATARSVAERCRELCGATTPTKG